MVAAILVLYRPTTKDLHRLLDSIVPQADVVLVVDNTPDPHAEILALVARYGPKTRYLPLGANRGIAYAQNVGIRKSFELGCSHVLLLDQDSVVPPGMIENLLAAEARLLGEGKAVAALGPQFYDEKTGKTYPAVRLEYYRVKKLYLDSNSTEPIEADYLISSGSMIRAEILNEVGLMRDDLFIDWVDVEWGLRARSMGLKSYHAPNVLMTHNVGDAVVTILGRDIHVHNDIRNYYMLRNALFLFRLKSMGLRWKITFLPRIPCYLFLYPFLAENRLRNLRFVVRALQDGLAGRMGEMYRGQAERS